MSFTKSPVLLQKTVQEEVADLVDDVLLPERDEVLLAEIQ